MCRGREVFRQYDVVRIKALNEKFSRSSVWLGSRSPAVGDEAAIIEKHDKPSLAYDLECVASDGNTSWAATFEPGDAEFELVRKNT